MSTAMIGLGMLIGVFLVLRSAAPTCRW